MRVVLAGGAGGVGSSLAFNLLLGPDLHDIVFVDPRAATALSHVMDLEQVLELGARGSVRVGSDDDVAGADVLVITASAPPRPNGSRLEYLHENAELVGRFADMLADQGPDWPGVVLMVTNPVDPLVMAFRARSGLDRRRVVGYTLNDSLRLRTGIARALGRPPGSVEAWVLGEHGDGSVPLFSAVRIDGAAVTLNAAQRAQASDFLHGWYLRHVALDPTRTSTWTSGMGLARMVAAIALGEPTPMPASVVLDGEYGLRGVSLTVPVMLGHSGVAEVLEWPVDEDEEQGLLRAADVVRAAAAQIHVGA
jgi:malate dehydrogenase